MLRVRRGGGGKVDTSRSGGEEESILFPKFARVSATVQHQHGCSGAAPACQEQISVADVSCREPTF